MIAETMFYIDTTNR